jgi:hypothetical protein
MERYIFEVHMESVINESFNEMVASYIRTLTNFYPARGSTGFTEANQVHIYINALMHCLDDDSAVSWLEFPWVLKKQHIDGFVYSPKYKSVFYIEAKRLSEKKKKQEIVDDIERLHCENKDFINENGIVDFENEYVIALSDVWLETKWKKEMPEWWCGLNNVPQQVLGWETKPNKPDTLEKPGTAICSKFENIDWTKRTSYAYWLGEQVKSVPNYCILMASSKI